MHAKLWEKMLNKIKAMRIQVMQITIRQYQKGNYFIQFHKTHNLKRNFFEIFFKSWKWAMTKYFWYNFSHLSTDMIKSFSS